MTNENQNETNRKNALKSTGPQSDEGKEIVSRNATKYGLYAKDVILKGGLVGEDPKEFEELLQSLIADLGPQGCMETILVEKIAATSWRLKRLFRAECGSIKSNIIIDYKAYRHEYGRFQCPVDIHEFVNGELPSLQEMTDEMMELAEKSNLEDDDLHKDEDFIELFEEKYPGKKISDLSAHQIKRLKSTYRNAIRDQLLEKVQFIRFVSYSTPQHQSALVPNDRIIRYGTTLERSLLRDLSALKKLQEMRTAN